MTGERTHMHKIIAGAAVAAAGLAVLTAPGASAAPSPKSSQLACFEGGDGTCTPEGAGSFELAIPANGNYTSYAGVYLRNKSLAGKPFASLSSLSFDYDGDITGGSPRFSLQVIGSDGRDGWVFVDAQSCDADADNTVDPINQVDCVVSGYYWNADDTQESFYYSSWSAFLGGEEGATVGSENPFVIYDFAPGGTAPAYTDNPAGSVTVSDIVLGNAKQR